MKTGSPPPNQKEIHSVRHYDSLHKVTVENLVQAWQKTAEHLKAQVQYCDVRLVFHSEGMVLEEEIETSSAETSSSIEYETIQLNTATDEQLTRPDILKIFFMSVSFPAQSTCEKHEDGSLPGPTDGDWSNRKIPKWQIRNNSHQCVVKITHDRETTSTEELDELLAVLNACVGLQKERTTFALALSGGGLRATLFHLGLVRMLKDAGLLSQVTEVVGISGGSILAAHMAANWKSYNGTPESFKTVSDTILHFARHDIRNRIIARTIFWIALSPLRWIARLLASLVHFIVPKNGPIKFSSGTWWGSPTYWLATDYENILFKKESPTISCLAAEFEADLAETIKPRFHILATGMKSGSLCTFTGDGILMEYGSEGDDDDFLHCETYPLSLAVAASSAFPVLFPAIKISPEILQCPPDDQYMSEEWLSDGGIFDNSGIRKLVWLANERKIKAMPSFKVAIVSDAGAPFKVEHQMNSGGLLRLFSRAPEVLMRRVADLEDEVTGLGKLAREIPLIPVSIQRMLDTMPDLSLDKSVQQLLSAVRTDLDKFSDPCIQALAMHGYSVARAEYNFYLQQIEADASEMKKFRKSTSTAWQPCSNKSSPANNGCLRDPVKVGSSPLRNEIYSGQSRSLLWPLAKQPEISLLLLVFVGVVFICSMLVRDEIEKDKNNLSNELDIRVREGLTQKAMGGGGQTFEVMEKTWLGRRSEWEKDLTNYSESEAVFEIEYSPWTEVESTLKSHIAYPNLGEGTLKGIESVAGCIIKGDGTLAHGLREVTLGKQKVSLTTYIGDFEKVSGSIGDVTKEINIQFAGFALQESADKRILLNMLQKPLGEYEGAFSKPKIYDQQFEIVNDGLEGNLFEPTTGVTIGKFKVTPKVKESSTSGTPNGNEQTGVKA